MPRMKIGGEELNVREEPFTPLKEDWNEYTVTGGIRLRMRVTALKMFRVLDEQGNPALTTDGDPHIVVRHNIQIAISA